MQKNCFLVVEIVKIGIMAPFCFGPIFSFCLKKGIGPTLLESNYPASSRIWSLLNGEG